jgi:peptidyl-prolyl cis-trans isomerase D
MIDRRILDQEALERGIEVGDDELLVYLETTFGVQAVSVDQYKGWVSSVFRKTVHQFEEDVRADVRGQKMARVITDTVAVSDDELKAEFRREHDRAMATVVKFSPELDKVAAPSEEAVAALLAEDEAQVKARFEKDSFRYRTAREVTARQIMRSVPRGGSDAEFAAARTALMELRVQLDKGADFAALAKEHSQDEATAAKGGDMGTIKPGMLGKALESAILPLKAGELIAEPVRTPLGVHLVQVTAVQEPETREFADVKSEVAASILSAKAAEVAAKADAESLLAKLKAGEALESLSATEDEARENTDETRALRRDTPWVLKGQESIPRVGTNKELHAALFAASEDAALLGEVYKVGQSYFVVQLKDRELPDMNDFDEEKESLRSQALSTKRNRVFRDWLNHLRSKASIQLNPSLFGPQSAS